ncbi:MAG: hypothetical protein R6T96_14605 [Longimicrobiales bacterium]
MNVDSILISEYATVDNVGRLTVVNVFNKINGPGPWAIPFFSISMVIHGHEKEAQTHHEGEIILLDSERERVKEDPIPFEFTFPKKSKNTPGMPVRFVVNLMIAGLVFERPGPYAFEVHIDGTYHASASLFIARTEA